MEPAWSGHALAIVPTYNERENITRLVAELRSLPGDVRVLVVDDNSPDGTGALVEEMAATDAGVRIIHREGKLGLGTAYKAGFHYGLANGYEYICTMDADYSHNPQSLPALLQAAARRSRSGGGQPVRGGRQGGRLDVAARADQFCCEQAGPCVPWR